MWTYARAFMQILFLNGLKLLIMVKYYVDVLSIKLSILWLSIMLLYQFRKNVHKGVRIIVQL